MPKRKPTQEQIAAEVAAFSSKPDCAYIDIVTLCVLRHRSRASTYRDVHLGLIPPPTKIGASSRWQVGAVRDALKEGEK